MTKLLALLAVGLLLLGLVQLARLLTPGQKTKLRRERFNTIYPKR